METGFLLKATTLNLHRAHRLLLHSHRTLFHRQQAEEIFIHLRGRAKDVVKFGMRNSGIDVTLNPDAIYALLRKHFATVPCSPLPLADFYTTLPMSNEDVYNYWLRLNQAVDVAADLLKEQGKDLHCPSLEVTCMFIKNCPSKELMEAKPGVGGCM